MAAGIEINAPCGIAPYGADRATRTRDISSVGVDCPRLHLTADEARRLFEAISHGGAIWSTWRGVTINLDLLASPSAPAMVLRALADHLRHWQAARSVPPYYAWVREHGGRHGDHVHILVAIPDSGGRALSQALARWLQGPSVRGDLPRGTLHSRPTDPAGWLTYCLKTVAPDDAETLRQAGLCVRPEQPAAPVVGQRIGIARALGPAARRTYV